MTETTPPPAAIEPQPSTGTQAATVTRAAPGWPYWLAWVVAAVLLAGAAAWWAQGRLSRLERDMARRIQAVEIKEQQRDEQIRLAQDLLRDTQGKVSLLEAKVAESVGQQAQLRQLYDEMARTRGDLMLADVENSIMLAAQQLQLTGNVQSALLALQDADQVLARANQPALIGLRRLLAQDIERLKAVPIADFGALVARLDAVVGAVDQMPLLAELAPAQTADPPDGPAAQAAQPRPAQPARTDRPDETSRPGGATQPAQPSTAPAEAEGGRFAELSDRVARVGRQGWQSFVTELRQLVRVQRVDQPDALLLAPDQRFFARENLRLMLLNARLNLLARNEALLRGDLARAAQAIERYFDQQNKSVAGALATLRQLQSARLTAELPSLSDSIGAVRAARAAADPARR